MQFICFCRPLQHCLTRIPSMIWWMVWRNKAWRRCPKDTWGEKALIWTWLSSWTSMRFDPQHHKITKIRWHTGSCLLFKVLTSNPVLQYFKTWTLFWHRLVCCQCLILVGRMSLITSAAAMAEINSFGKQMIFVWVLSISHFQLMCSNWQSELPPMIILQPCCHWQLRQYILYYIYIIYTIYTPPILNLLGQF